MLNNGLSFAKSTSHLIVPSCYSNSQQRSAQLATLSFDASSPLRALSSQRRDLPGLALASLAVPSRCPCLGSPPPPRLESTRVCRAPPTSVFPVCRASPGIPIQGHGIKWHESIYQVCTSTFQPTWLGHWMCARFPVWPVPGRVLAPSAACSSSWSPGNSRCHHPLRALTLVPIPILPGIQSCSNFCHLYLQTHPWSSHPTHLPYWPGPWPPSTPWSFKVFKLSACTCLCYSIWFSTIQSDLWKHKMEVTTTRFFVP